MADHDLEQLLGGFAADQLTPEEQARLYSAALHDQQLFEALADEQALKELLADPAVRRRLLLALKQAGAADHAAPVTWLDRFRQPSGLAWAGGLAAAAIAVVLGTKLYEDGLKQAAQSVTTEDRRPAAPPTPAPPLSQPPSSSIPDVPSSSEPQEPPTKKGAKKNPPLNQMIRKREQTVAPASREQKSSDSAAGLEKQNRTYEEPRSQAESLSDELRNAPAHTSPSVPQKPRQDPSDVSASAPIHRAPPSESMGPGTIAPAVSARALFFKNDDVATAFGMGETERQQPLDAMAEPAPYAGKPERKDRTERRLSEQGLGLETVKATRPLGLRYSFMVQATDGRNREVTTVASDYSGPLLLTVEANQEVYLQLWITIGSHPPQRFFPREDGGQTELKLFAGQRQSVLIPTKHAPITITARVSRTVLGSTFEQDPSSTARQTPDPLQELVTTGAQSPYRENATYVVHQDASTNQLTVRIPFPTP